MCPSNSNPRRIKTLVMHWLQRERIKHIALFEVKLNLTENQRKKNSCWFVFSLWTTLYCLEHVLFYPSERTVNSYTRVWKLESDGNPPQENRWRLYILPKCLANLTEPTGHKESQIFTIFVPVLRTLSSLVLKILQRFCTFLWTLLRFLWAKNYG